MADSITIQSIQPDSMVIILNLSGQAWQKTLPFLTTQDPARLTTQLQTFASEMRDEFAALKAAIQAADASTPPPVADAVTALIGQEIPVDATVPPPAA